MPQAIKCGLSYSEFMDSTPKIVRVYMDVYDKEQERRYKELDYLSWLNGMYVMHAIGAVMSKDAKYPSKPFSEEQAEKMEAKEAPEIDAINFGAWVAEFNKRKIYEGGE